MREEVHRSVCVREHGASTAHRVACGLMAAAAVGLITAAVLGAPLVSVLLAGLLLVCPMLMWVPFRYERSALDGSARGNRRDG